MFETVHQNAIQTFLIDRFSEGVETPDIFFGIHGHALKDVAIALTFRSGKGKKTTNSQMASAIFHKSTDVRPTEHHDRPTSLSTEVSRVSNTSIARHSRSPIR